MNPTIEHQVAELTRPYAGAPSELIQALHRVQSELGHIPVEAQAAVAKALGVPPSQVRGVITFYHFFRTTPVGRHTLRLCLGTACHVRGADLILRAIREELGVGLGGTTADGMFTVEGVRCLGACGLAPVMMVNQEVYGKLDPKRTKRILRQIREGGG
ncbi:MAG TPA: NADH-quinone oxidoreductase subunit NuoE [Candidatus Acetothermia bacterium]|nr:NADH-quinone oxidoreductase subunit NuoE [Candidatus Acetothermia bacterium]